MQVQLQLTGSQAVGQICATGSLKANLDQCVKLVGKAAVGGAKVSTLMRRPPSRAQTSPALHRKASVGRLFHCRAPVWADPLRLALF